MNNANKETDEAGNEKIHMKTQERAQASKLQL